MLDIEFAKGVLDSESTAIREMIDLLDDAFLQAGQMMQDCTGSVIVTGIGKAGLIGSKISATLASTGTPSHFLHPAEAVHGDLGRIRKEDLVLALSHSGESEELIRLLNPLKQQRIPMILVTGEPQSRLAQHSDVVLNIGRIYEACPLGVAPSVSTTCMLALGDALALTLMKARQFSPEDYARYHPAGALGAKLMTVGQSMMFQHGDPLPLASMHDTIEHMLRMTAELKRRGAVMIVDEEGRLAGIITDADLRRAILDRGEGILHCRTFEIMTPHCKRVTENALAAEAMAIFHEHRIDDLPVVDENDRPVGMIDVQDIVTIKIAG